MALNYFLCATPRSGSTLLCDLLADTGRAGRPQSYYRLQDMERRARGYGLRPGEFAGQAAFDQAYLDAVLREGAGETGVFGLRIMWGTVAEMAERLSPLRPELSAAELFEALFGPLAYVHVSRRDKVAQAISLLKAEQSGLWHLAADGSERQRTAPPATPHYDEDRIAALVGELEREDASWRAFFADSQIKPTPIEYEALAAAPGAELQKVLSALGLPPELAQAAQVATAKMADSESNAWADRFRRARLLGRSRAEPPAGGSVSEQPSGVFRPDLFLLGGGQAEFLERAIVGRKRVLRIIRPKQNMVNAHIPDGPDEFFLDRRACHQGHGCRYVEVDVLAEETLRGAGRLENVPETEVQPADVRKDELRLGQTKSQIEQRFTIARQDVGVVQQHDHAQLPRPPGEADDPRVSDSETLGVGMDLEDPDAQGGHPLELRDRRLPIIGMDGGHGRDRLVLRGQGDQRIIGGPDRGGVSLERLIGASEPHGAEAGDLLPIGL